ncbi:MAG: GNAT family N-acetyltransferase [Rhodoferax sp.]
MLLRSAAPDDALAVARVHVRAWQVAYRSLLPQDYLNQLRPEDRAKRYDFGSADLTKPATIVAICDESIVGFATVGSAQDSNCRGTGELCALYVDPDWWGRGVGRALIEQARYRLRECGFRSAVLWVMAGNSSAEQFYVCDGWTLDGMQRPASVWGITVEEIRYGRALD